MPLSRNYHGCTVVSTPDKFEEERNERGVPTGEILCDGWRHEVLGPNKVSLGTFGTLGLAVAAAKQQHGPYEDRPLVDTAE